MTHKYRVTSFRRSKGILLPSLLLVYLQHESQQLFQRRVQLLSQPLRVIHALQRHVISRILYPEFERGIIDAIPQAFSG